MPRENTKNALNSVEIEYTTRPVSGWGGLVSLFRFFASLGVRDWLAQALPDGKSSNNRVGAVDSILQFMTSVLIGGTRFEHVERLRADPVIKQIIEAKRVGSASVLTRYLGNFLPSQVQHLIVTLSRLTLGLLSEREDVLDLDSTVFLRHGTQEGSSFGYNPRRRRQPSHHPVLAMLAKSKMIVHAWLRAGSAPTNRGVGEFLKEVLELLPRWFRITALRADSGFYCREFLSLLDERSIPYVMAVSNNLHFTKWCASRTGWIAASRNVDLTEADYTGRRWKAPRRMIVIRKAIRREEDGVLFEIIDFEYRALVTSLELDPIAVWKLYNGRGDCENRIKELKHDFAASGYCLQSFHGTEAALQLICFTFNLVSLFKKKILHDTSITLGTIRHRIFVIGAVLGSSGRRTVLRLGLRGRWKDEFTKLLAAVDRWVRSTAAQLTDLFASAELQAPSPWRVRRPPDLARFIGY